MSDIDLKTALGLVPEDDFAAFRGVQRTALANERARGEGPPFTKIGKAVFYPLKSLREYAAKQAVVPAKANTLIDGKRTKRAKSGGQPAA
jgi:hypothetical protein